MFPKAVSEKVNFEEKNPHNKSMKNYPVCKVIVLPYSKTCLKRPLSKRPQTGFQDRLLFNAGQKYCRILQYFRLSLSYHLSLRSLFCLLLSGRFKQVLLYFVEKAGSQVARQMLTALETLVRCSNHLSYLGGSKSAPWHILSS